MNRRACAFFLAFLLPASQARGADVGGSLNKCQTNVAVATTKYVRAVTKAVGTCLDAMSASVIGKGLSVDAAATTNAGTCAAMLLRLRSSQKPTVEQVAKFRTKVASSCDPAVNGKLLFDASAVWTVGPTTLSAANLALYCRSAGGPGSLASVDDWSECLVAAADCQVRQAIGLRWPRALEYFAALRSSLAGLPPTVKTVDALAALTEIDVALEGTTDDDVPELTCGSSSGLLATGQTQCDQGDGTFGACPGADPGQDGEVRAGIPGRFTDNGDGTITDHVTGLMWERLSRDGSPSDADTQIGRWTDGVRVLRQSSPPWSQGLAGYFDWRAPNRRELESLVDLGRHDPAIDPVFHHDCTPGCTVEQCSCTNAGLYWTSSHVKDSGDSWAVSFADGSVVPVGREQTLPVRAVRGGNLEYAIEHGPPVAGDYSLLAPWKTDCIVVPMWGYDLDAGCILGVEITSFPAHGYLSEFAPLTIGDGGDDCSDPVPGASIRGTTQGFHMYEASLCYVTFSTTFLGTDSFTYDVIDRQGNRDSGTALITVAELD